MLRSGWSGRELLDPTSRAYKQQVAIGNLPDPAKVEGPKQYTARDIPDDLRAITPEDLRRVAPRGGNEGVIGNYHVKQTGDPADEHGNGVNTTFILTAQDGSGRRYVVKLDTYIGDRGAANEVNYSQMLRAVNYYGASYVERHPTNNAAIISTFVGEQNGIVRRTIIHDERRPTADIARNLADPSELFVARILNTITANNDRHAGNAMWGEDADGKTHLLLFDHGFAGLSDRDRWNAQRALTDLRVAYGPVLASVMRDMGSQASVTMIQERAQQLLDQLERMVFNGDDGRRAVMIRRLQEIINNPQMVYDITTRRF